LQLTFIKLVLSGRGGHCDFSPRASKNLATPLLPVCCICVYLHIPIFESVLSWIFSCPHNITVYVRQRQYRSINTIISIVAGFSKALVVCVCFLTVIRVPTVMSAPISRHNSVDYDERMHSHPKWINPCGLRASDDFDSELEGVPRLNDNELLSSIIVSAKNALMHAQRFKDSYVSTLCIYRECTFP